MSGRRRILPCLATAAALLLVPALALAGRYQPDQKWLAATRADEPFLPYRLGVVEYDGGAGESWHEFLGDMRATLRGSNYFQREEAPRLRLQITSEVASGTINADTGCKTTPGSLAMTYRFLDGEREVSRMTIETPAPMKGSSDNFDAALAANLKYLLLELRRDDPAFATRASELEAELQRSLGKGSTVGCKVGNALARGFMATMEGAAAVVTGIGEVAGAALEVAASPEFQSTLNTALAEHQYQQMQQQAYLDQLNAQGEATRRQQEAREQAQARAQAEQQAAQQQAGREALARQLAEGIAYRNQQLARTTDAGTRQRLVADNEAALQAAAQIGMHAQVDTLATRATQAGFDQARAGREAAAQAEQQRIAEQAQAQREREARQRAEEQRLAQEQAAAERRRKDEEARLAREREAEQRRLAAEQAEREKREAWAAYLGELKRGIRLGAKQCDGKERPYRLVGDRPGVPLPRVISHYSSCISVRYEARCPGAPRGAGIKATQYNFTGLGLGCLSAESLMPQRLACADSEVVVETLEVTGCS